MESEYSNYKFLKLKDIATINLTRDIFEDLDNAFYIPAIGLTDIREKMPEVDSKKKLQNFFQIAINDKRVKKKYLVNYFNSEHGQKSIKLEFSKYEGAAISRLRKPDIENILIPLPNLGIQDEIIENISKLHKVKELLASIESSLSFKPISSSDLRVSLYISSALRCLSGLCSKISNIFSRGSVTFNPAFFNSVLCCIYDYPIINN